MKVLYISRNLQNPSGGAQYAARRLLDYLSKKSDIRLYCISPKPIERTITLPNINYHSTIPLIDYFLLNKMYSKYIDILIKNIDPDLIHIHSYSGFAPIVKTKIPVLITFHDESFTNYFEDIFSSIPIKIAFKILSNIRIYFRSKLLMPNYFFHSLSSNMTSLLLKNGIKREHIFTIPFGTYNESFKNNEFKLSEEKIKLLDEKSFNIICVGQIYPLKGQHVLIKAIQEINSPDIRLYIIGDPMPLIGTLYQNQLKKLLKNANLCDKVFWLGNLNRETLNYFYSHADLFISSSYSEGCQLTPLEAASQNIPIICSDVGAARDLFKDQIKYFSKGNYKHLAYLIQEHMKNKSRIKYKIKTFEDSANEIAQAYKKIISYFI